MSQISKLYGFCFRKIFKKNWLRITLVTLAITATWFAIPYFSYKLNSEKLARSLEEGTTSYENIDFLDDDKKEELLTNAKKKVGSFSTWHSFCLEDEEILRKVFRKKLGEGVKKLEEAKKKNASNGVLEKIKKEIDEYERLDKGKSRGSNYTFFTGDNCFFFCRTDDYWKGESGWKLLNNISWWNLTGFIFLFYLVFNILDSSFFDSKKDGEEANILLLTPGVKRSDLLLSRILAFLTFYFLANIFIFLLPFGIFYFWVGTKTSIVAFSLLALWTVIIGPILFFLLILAPYLFLRSWVSWLSFIIPSLISFFPQLWELGKWLAYPHATWPYKVEGKFFDLSIFISASLILGILSLVLLYWQYQEEDLGQSL